jgi:hypothetical protein
MTNAPCYTGNMAFAMFFKMYGIRVEADPLIAATFSREEREWISGGALEWVPPVLADAYKQLKTGIQTIYSNSAHRTISSDNVSCDLRARFAARRYQRHATSALRPGPCDARP